MGNAICCSGATSSFCDRITASGLRCVSHTLTGGIDIRTVNPESKNTVPVFQIFHRGNGDNSSSFRCLAFRPSGVHIETARADDKAQFWTFAAFPREGSNSNGGGNSPYDSGDGHSVMTPVMLVPVTNPGYCLARPVGTNFDPKHEFRGLPRKPIPFFGADGEQFWLLADLKWENTSDVFIGYRIPTGRSFIGRGGDPNASHQSLHFVVPDDAVVQQPTFIRTLFSSQGIPPMYTAPAFDMARPTILRQDGLTPPDPKVAGWRIVRVGEFRPEKPPAATMTPLLTKTPSSQQQFRFIQHWQPFRPPRSGDVVEFVPDVGFGSLALMYRFDHDSTNVVLPGGHWEAAQEAAATSRSIALRAHQCVPLVGRSSYFKFTAWQLADGNPSIRTGNTYLITDPGVSHRGYRVLGEGFTSNDPRLVFPISHINAGRSSQFFEDIEFRFVADPMTSGAGYYELVVVSGQTFHVMYDRTRAVHVVYERRKTVEGDSRDFRLQLHGSSTTASQEKTASTTRFQLARVLQVDEQNSTTSVAPSSASAFAQTVAKADASHVALQLRAIAFRPSSLSDQDVSSVFEPGNFATYALPSSWAALSREVSGALVEIAPRCAPHLRLAVDPRRGKLVLIYPAGWSQTSGDAASSHVREATTFQYYVEELTTALFQRNTPLRCYLLQRAAAAAADDDKDKGKKEDFVATVRIVAAAGNNNNHGDNDTSKSSSSKNSSNNSNDCFFTIECLEGGGGALWCSHAVQPDALAQSLDPNNEASFVLRTAPLCSTDEAHHFYIVPSHLSTIFPEHNNIVAAERQQQQQQEKQQQSQQSQDSDSTQIKKRIATDTTFAAELNNHIANREAVSRNTNAVLTGFRSAFTEAIEKHFAAATTTQQDSSSAAEKPTSKTDILRPCFSPLLCRQLSPDVILRTATMSATGAKISNNSNTSVAIVVALLVSKALKVPVEAACNVTVSDLDKQQRKLTSSSSDSDNDASSSNEEQHNNRRVKQFRTGLNHSSRTRCFSDTMAYRNWQINVVSLLVAGLIGHNNNSTVALSLLDVLHDFGTAETLLTVLERCCRHLLIYSQNNGSGAAAAVLFEMRRAAADLLVNRLAMELSREAVEDATTAAAAAVPSTTAKSEEGDGGKRGASSSSSSSSSSHPAADPPPRTSSLARRKLIFLRLAQAFERVKEHAFEVELAEPAAAALRQFHCQMPAVLRDDNNHNSSNSNFTSHSDEDVEMQRARNIVDGGQGLILVRAHVAAMMGVHLSAALEDAEEILGRKPGRDDDDAAAPVAAASSAEAVAETNNNNNDGSPISGGFFLPKSTTSNRGELFLTSTSQVLQRVPLWMFDSAVSYAQSVGVYLQQQNMSGFVQRLNGDQSLRRLSAELRKTARGFERLVEDEYGIKPRAAKYAGSRLSRPGVGESRRNHCAVVEQLLFKLQLKTASCVDGESSGDDDNIGDSI